MPSPTLSNHDFHIKKLPLLTWNSIQKWQYEFVQGTCLQSVLFIRNSSILRCSRGLFFDADSPFRWRPSATSRRCIGTPKFPIVCSVGYRPLWRVPVQPILQRRYDMIFVCVIRLILNHQPVRLQTTPSKIDSSLPSAN